MKKLFCSTILAIILGATPSLAQGSIWNCKQKLGDLVSRAKKVNPIIEDRRSGSFSKQAAWPPPKAVKEPPPSQFKVLRQKMNPWPRIKGLWREIMETPAVKQAKQKFLRITWNPGRLRYLRYMARRSSSSTWDRMRLVEMIKTLYEQGEISDEYVRAIVEDPRLKNFSKYLEIQEINQRTRKLVIHDYEVREKVAHIKQIVNQVVEDDNWEITKDWVAFFFRSDLAVEELQVLKEQLTKPIPYEKIIYYQSYINFAQSYRLDNNGLVVSGLNKIIPGYEKLTSLEAFKYIKQVDGIDYKASVLSRSGRLVPKGPGARFLRKFRRYFKKVDKYYGKTLKKERSKQVRINRQAVAEVDREIKGVKNEIAELEKREEDHEIQIAFRKKQLQELEEKRAIVKLNDEEIETLARNDAVHKRFSYQKLYMGCRVMRTTDNHVKNFGRFAKFFIGVGLLFDGAGYALRTPNNDVRTFSREYWQELGEATKNPRWRSILRYELMMSFIYSYSSFLFISNPFAGKIEKSIGTYFRTSIISVGDSYGYDRLYGNSEEHALKLLAELTSREDFERFQNRIWDILEAAELDDEFLLALEEAALEEVERTGAVYRPGEMSTDMIRHPSVWQVLKEVPARIAEKEEAIAGTTGITEIYAESRGISMKEAMEEIEETLADPEQRRAWDELRQYVRTINLEGKVKETLENLTAIFRSRPLSANSTRPDLSVTALQEERAQEIFLEALNEEIYLAQSGEMIRTGNMGVDRLLFYRGIWSPPSSVKSILVGIYLYQVLCMGDGSQSSLMHAFGIKLVENAVSAYFHWKLRYCAIGKGQNPSFEEIFSPETRKKEDLCEDIFFKDKVQFIRESAQGFLNLFP